MDEDKYLKQKIDQNRRKKLLEDKQDRMLADMRKRDTTSINQLENPDSDIRRIRGGTEHINTKQIIPQLDSGSFQSKIQALLKNSAAKKALGVLPMAGTVAGLMSGDPVMAAEEAAGDIPGIGQAYEAMKSGDAGESEEDEKMMLAEDQARKNYAKSPAALNKRPLPNSSPSPYFSKLAKSMRSELGDKASSGLASDEVPHEEAQGLQADEIAPEMESSIQRELPKASKEDEMLRRLMNLKG